MGTGVAEAVEDDADEGATVIIDLGEHARKKVKRLRKGKGRLMEKVEDAVEQLKAEGVLAANAQTVVVVVREEPSLAGLFSDDDDDD